MSVGAFTNLRLLLSTGLAEKASMPHSRMAYFVYSDTAMENRMALTARSVETFKRLLTKAAGAVPPRDPARHHIDDSLEWSDLLLEAFDHASERWRDRHPAGPHPHGLQNGD